MRFLAGKYGGLPRDARVPHMDAAGEHGRARQLPRPLRRRDQSNPLLKLALVYRNVLLLPLTRRLTPSQPRANNARMQS